jgi:DNA (cytosine-5)-methyltransferase 1
MIFKIFMELGYDMQSSVLKSEEFGVPQTRRRAVFIGQKSKLKAGLPTDSSLRTTVNQAISDLPHLESGDGQEFVKYTNASRSLYQTKMRKNSKGVWNHIATKHSKIALERLSYIPVGGNKHDLPLEHRTKSIHSGTWSRLKADGFARTITTRFDTPSSGQFTLPGQNRCITVREAARLQSFPDTFIFTGTKSSQMTQVGNAVPPLMAEAIALEIRKGLKSLVVTDDVLARKKQVPVLA